MPRYLVSPAARVHFLDEQRRNRRIGRFVSLLVIAGLVVSGIPLSVFISPALVLVALLAAHIADVFVTVSPDVWDNLRSAVFVLPETWRAMRSDAALVPWRTLILVLVAPGTVAMLVIWSLIRTLFRNVGVGGMLRGVGARDPEADSTEERRFVNLVQEMSVAAGVEPPHVLIVDSEAANVAAVGLSIDDATVIVSSGLMSKLTRDEAQAVIAHVIGSVGNGDLRITAQILSVLQTWGFVSLLVDASFGPRSRLALEFVVRNAIESARGRSTIREGERALDLLLAGTEQSEDVMNLTEDIVERNRHPMFDLFVTLPILLTLGVAAIAARTVIWLFTLLVAGPWIALLWRSRRRLADATAIQLTRNPDALAAALRTLSQVDVRMPGAIAVNFLFPVWDKDVDKGTARSDAASLVLGMHLDYDKRLETVSRLGAQVVDSPHGEQPVTAKRQIGDTIREVPSFAMWLVIAVVLVALLLAANLAAVSLAMMVVWWLLGFLFVTIPNWFSRML